MKKAEGKTKAVSREPHGSPAKGSTTRQRPHRKTEQQPHPGAPCDTLAHMQVLREQVHDYQPITYQRAGEIADELLTYDDDLRAFALIQLVRGMAAAHFAGRCWQEGQPVPKPTVEDLVYATMQAAYPHTAHASYSLEEFAALDPTNPRDLRVLRHQIRDEPEGGDEQ